MGEASLHPISRVLSTIRKYFPLPCYLIIPGQVLFLVFIPTLRIARVKKDFTHQGGGKTGYGQ
jgi:hypothetical protein